MRTSGAKHINIVGDEDLDSELSFDPRLQQRFRLSETSDRLYAWPDQTYDWLGWNPNSVLDDIATHYGTTKDLLTTSDIYDAIKTGYIAARVGQQLIWESFGQEFDPSQAGITIPQFSDRLHKYSFRSIVDRVVEWLRYADPELPQRLHILPEENIKYMVNAIAKDLDSNPNDVRDALTSIAKISTLMPDYPSFHAKPLEIGLEGGTFLPQAVLPLEELRKRAHYISRPRNWPATLNSDLVDGLREYAFGDSIVDRVMRWLHNNLPPSVVSNISLVDENVIDDLIPTIADNVGRNEDDVRTALMSIVDMTIAGKSAKLPTLSSLGSPFTTLAGGTVVSPEEEVFGLKDRMMPITAYLNSDLVDNLHTYMSLKTYITMPDQLDAAYSIEQAFLTGMLEREEALRQLGIVIRNAQLADLDISPLLAIGTNMKHLSAPIPPDFTEGRHPSSRTIV